MKTLVLLSGGMDSVTALHWARAEHEVAGAVSFDYGAKHNARECRWIVLIGAVFQFPQKLSKGSCAVFSKFQCKS